MSHFLLRVDNLFDKFESHKQDPHFLSLKKLESHVENKIFKGQTPADVAVIIQEVSFGGYELLRNMISKKNAWNGLDDDKLDLSGIVKDKN